MIETIEDRASFEALRPEWTELLEDSTSNCFFLTWEWLYTWWKHLAGERRLSILTVRHNEELIAIAPLALNTRFSERLPFGTLEFLGAGTVSSDHMDLIIRRGHDEQVIAALGEHLDGRKLGLKLVHFNRTSSLVERMASQLTPRGWSICEAPMFLCPFINLTGCSWDSYLGTLSAKNRGDLQRRLRKLNKQFNVSVDMTVSQEQRRHALTLLFTLHDRRWQARGGSEAFHSAALRAFHEEVSQLALERGWLRLFVLGLDGKPAAARYGFRYGSTYYSYQSGFDPAYSSLGLGLITVALAIQRAIAEGAEEYDLLAGNEEYKFRLASEARELGRLELYPPGVPWLLYRQAITFYRAARSSAHRNTARLVNATRKFA